MAPLTTEALRSALRDHLVRKRRPLHYGHGFYVDAEDLLAALHRRDVAAQPGALDDLVGELGGQRLEYGWLRSLQESIGLRPRPVEYYFDGPTYQRLRQTRR